MENGINQTTSATTCTAAVNPLSSSSLPLPLSSPSSITAPSRSEQHNSNSNLNSNLNSQNGESSQKNDSEREIVAKQDQNHAEIVTLKPILIILTVILKMIKTTAAKVHLIHTDLVIKTIATTTTTSVDEDGSNQHLSK